MLRFNSALFAFAAEFVGQYVPYQGIEIAPLAGGVSIAATNRGAVAMLAFDPNGLATETTVLLPGDELARACKGIKTAQRELVVEDDNAVVTTYYKGHSTSKEFPVHRSRSGFPALRQVIRSALRYWGETPELSRTAGRYDVQLLHRSIKAMVDDADSVVLSAFQGGPLRLQREDIDRCEIVVLLMPQEAQAIPPVPPWLATYVESLDESSDLQQAAA